MLHELMIRTDDRLVLEPLLRVALEREKNFVKMGIARTQERLRKFELLYEMNSDKFERRLSAFELAETPEFADWRMEIGMLRLLERQQRALFNVHFN